MNSPTITGKTETLDSIPMIGTPKNNKNQQNNFLPSPMIKPS